MIGRLSGLGRREARTRATELLDQFDLADAAGRILKEYSGGMRGRLDLAAGLVTRPPVLFLDEPTTGLDPTSRLRMWDVIRELVGDGVTLLLTTQYLDEADELADRIVVIDHGRVIAGGTPAELKAEIGGAGSRSRSAEANPAASGALGTVRGRPVHLSQDGHRLRAPVRSGGGLASDGRARPRRRRDHRRRRGGPSALARRRVLRAHRPPRRDAAEAGDRDEPTWR